MADEPLIRITAASGLRLRPADLRQLTKATGRTFDQLINSEETADKMQALAFLELRRRHPDYDADQMDPMQPQEGDDKPDSGDDVEDEEED